MGAAHACGRSCGCKHIDIGCWGDAAVGDAGLMEALPADGDVSMCGPELVESGIATGSIDMAKPTFGASPWRPRRVHVEPT